MSPRLWRVRQWRATTKLSCMGVRLSICFIHPHVSTCVPVSENNKKQKQNNNLHKQHLQPLSIFSFLMGIGPLWNELRWHWLAMFEIARRAKHVITNVFQVPDNCWPKMRWKAALGFLPGNERSTCALLMVLSTGSVCLTLCKNRLLGSLWAVQGERWY